MFVGEGWQRNSARSEFDRVGTFMFVITRNIVTANEDLSTFTDFSSLPSDRDNTRRFLFPPFPNGRDRGEFPSIFYSRASEQKKVYNYTHMIYYEQ